MAKRVTAKYEDEMSAKYGAIGAGIIGLFLIIAFAIGRLTGTAPVAKETAQVISEDNREEKTTNEQRGEIKPPTNSQAPSVTVPKEWKRYTAKDPQFHFQTTLALPTTYLFEFTGSEFVLRNQNTPSDEWSYHTSIFGGKDGVKNYYTGESRRVWYQNYLNKDFFPKENYVESPDQILSVTEHPLANGSSYLAATVMTKFGSQIHYLYGQNNIIHIFVPSTQTTQSKFPSLLPQILLSLKSEQI